MVTPWKPTRQEIAAAVGRVIPDVIGPDLKILFCGINPSLYSAAVGHHFARPGNRFWPALHQGGFTERCISPFEDATLLERGYGLTNLAARATASAEELSAGDLKRGRLVLEEKVLEYCPRCVAFLGITAYRIAFARPRAHLGRQRETCGNAVLWVLPNPSGRQAHYQLETLAGLFAELATTFR